MYLEEINCPDDLKKFDLEKLNKLPSEMRELIKNKVNTIGGHLSPNLGIIETTIALHYVFNSPVDKIIFDVSHQCYPHKMLTGRKDAFLYPEKYMDCTGYTAPDESPHDMFTVGHTSTAASLAVGVAKARDLKHENYNVIAIVGDGSLSGGQAFEGLDNAATLNSNIIIIINDNEMSIAENHGGLYDNLKLLRDTKGDAECNFFKSLGFKYYYLDEGNNIEKLVELFNKVKDTNSPTILHIHTLKGNGIQFAEEHKELTHWMMPHLLDNIGTNMQEEESYCSITKDYIMDKLKTDNSLVVINAGTPGVFGYTSDFRNALGEHYTDVGIAEEHAIAYSSALAKNGAKPIMSFMCSFVQRVYDQFSQDLCLNSSPATILIHWAGISSADVTHLCCFDIPLLSNIPNFVYLAPTNKEEYLAMLKYSVEQTKYPVAIRVPSNELTSCGIEDTTDYSLLNKYELKEMGSKVAIIGLGSFYNLAAEVKNEIKEKLNIDATLINPKFITGIDEEMLESLKQNHDLVITLEDGILDGGFGEKIARFYGTSNVKVLNYGAKKEFTDRVPLEELYERYHLTKELITEDITSLLLTNVIK